MKVRIERGYVGDCLHVVFVLYSSEGEYYGTITMNTRMDLSRDILDALGNAEIID